MADNVPAPGGISPPLDQTIHNSYLAAKTLFKQALEIVRSEECLAVTLGQISPERFADDFSKLQFFGTDTGAEINAGLRDSLDQRLRKSADLKETVLSQLNQIYDSAKEEGRIDAGEELSDADGASSSESKVVKLQDAIEDISKSTVILSRFPALIRRPMVLDKPLMSESQQSQPVIAAFVFHDRRHVSEKIRMWRQNQSSADSIVSTSPDTVANVAVSLSDPELSKRDNELIDRLSNAITRGREQLGYWSRHPDREDLPSRDLPHQQIEGTLTGAQTLPVRAVELASEAYGGEERAKVLSAAKSIGQSNPTVNTLHTQYSAVAQSDIGEISTLANNPRTVYAPSSLAGARSSQAVMPPVPPIARTASSFDCPYCRATLESKRMLTEKHWKRHVFWDLRPYVCISPECSSPSKLYVKRQAWVEHDLLTHRRHWRCISPCKFQTDARLVFMEHLRSEHARDVEEDDVEEIADMQDLQIEDSVECQCSLCLQAMPFSKFYDHTAGHLEDLALFVLNGASEDEEAALEDGDADSKAVVGLAHERQEKLSTSELEMDGKIPHDPGDYEDFKGAILKTMYWGHRDNMRPYQEKDLPSWREFFKQDTMWETLMQENSLLDATNEHYQNPFALMQIRVTGIDGEDPRFLSFPYSSTDRLFAAVAGMSDSWVGADQTLQYRAGEKINVIREVEIGLWECELNNRIGNVLRRNMLQKLFTVPAHARALVGFNNSSDDEAFDDTCLPLQEGDLLIVFQEKRRRNWSRGHAYGKIGMFPDKRVMLLPTREYARASEDSTATGWKYLKFKKDDLITKVSDKTNYRKRTWGDNLDQPIAILHGREGLIADDDAKKLETTWSSPWQKWD